MSSKPKEVYFDIWCRKCKHKKVDETEPPCDECLEQGFNIDSHKPLRFEEKET